MTADVPMVEYLCPHLQAPPWKLVSVKRHSGLGSSVLGCGGGRGGVREGESAGVSASGEGEGEREGEGVNGGGRSTEGVRDRETACVSVRLSVSERAPTWAAEEGERRSHRRRPAITAEEVSWSKTSRGLRASERSERGSVGSE